MFALRVDNIALSKLIGLGRIVPVYKSPKIRKERSGNEHKPRRTSGNIGKGDACLAAAGAALSPGRNGRRQDRHESADKGAGKIQHRKDSAQVHSHADKAHPLLHRIHDRRGSSGDTDNLLRRHPERRRLGHLPLAAGRAFKPLQRRHAALRQTLQSRRLRRSWRRRRYRAGDRLHTYQDIHPRQQDNLHSQQRSILLKDRELYQRGETPHRPRLFRRLQLPHRDGQTRDTGGRGKIPQGLRRSRSLCTRQRL